MQQIHKFFAGDGFFFQKEVSEGVDDKQVNALKDSGRNTGASEDKTEE